MFLKIMLICSLFFSSVHVENETCVIQGEIVNPFYRGIQVTEEAEGAIPFSLRRFENREDAEAYIKQGFLNRQEIIAFEYDVKETLTKADLVEMINQTFLHTGVPNEGDYIYFQFGSCRYEATYNSGCYQVTIRNTYYSSYEEELMVDEKISALMDELSLKEKNDFEKIKTIYEYVTSHVTYDFENVNQLDYVLKFSAYGALMDGKAVCQGYAVLLYRLFLECGIDCRIISGKAGNVPHSWNIVKINDAYANIDATWDAGNDNYQYFLRGNDFFETHTRDQKYQLDSFKKVYPIHEENMVEDTHTFGDWYFLKDNIKRRDCLTCDDYEKSTFVWGDVNGDGVLTAKDRMILTRYLASWTGYTKEKIDLVASDVNKDGEVNNQDRMILTRHLASWSEYSSLPYNN